MTKSRPYDVYISHASADYPLADYVAHGLAKHGLVSFTPRDAIAARSRIVADALRDALTESFALVAIVTPTSIKNPNVMYEVGAAFAWNKAVFVVLNETQPSELPIALAGFEWHTLSDIDALANSIKNGSQTLTTEEEKQLGEAYKEVGVTVDTLFRRQTALKRLSDEFNLRAGKTLSREVVLESLLRLRKQGKLPRLEAGRIRKRNG